MTDFGLYIIITAPVLPYKILAEICVDRQIKMIQLREKELCDRKILNAADDILSITKGTETKLIINDRVDLARITDSDGVHLGQEDISLECGKMLYPNSNKIWGLSTHSPEQSRTALKRNPHYIAYGPIFPTPTKKIPDPSVGIGSLSNIIKQSKIPVVAIGGLFPENIPEIIEAGARNMCMVRHFMECRREEELLKRIDHVNDLLEATS